MKNKDPGYEERVEHMAPREYDSSSPQKRGWGCLRNPIPIREPVSFY